MRHLYVRDHRRPGRGLAHTIMAAGLVVAMLSATPVSARWLGFRTAEDPIPPPAISRMLARRGFEAMSNPRFRDDVYIVHALTPTGARVRLVIDAYDGAIIRSVRLEEDLLPPRNVGREFADDERDDVRDLGEAPRARDYVPPRGREYIGEAPRGRDYVPDLSEAPRGWDYVPERSEAARGHDYVPYRGETPAAQDYAPYREAPSGAQRLQRQPERNAARSEPPGRSPAAAAPPARRGVPAAAKPKREQPSDDKPAVTATAPAPEVKQEAPAVTPAAPAPSVETSKTEAAKPEAPAAATDERSATTAAAPAPVVKQDAPAAPPAVETRTVETAKPDSKAAEKPAATAPGPRSQSVRVIEGVTPILPQDRPGESGATN